MQNGFFKTCGAILGAIASGIVAITPVQACTSFLIWDTGGSPVYGRTMEFGFALDSKMIVIPRKFSLTATGPDGKLGGGMPWQSKYAVVGLNAFDMPIVVDGMNEKGLTGGILYFPTYVGYADPKTADPKSAMAPWDFLTWALTNFATVAEFKEAVNGIAIIDVTEPTLEIVPPFHYTLHDATGASLVIEPVSGTLKVYDNPFGVMTNAPEFDWHMTNLKNYVKLTPFNAPPLKLRGDTIPSFGQGSGLLGIPGDPTPPSRLIRALGYTMSVKPVAPGVESVRLAEHVANNFDIPLGWIQDGGNSKEPLEYTQWTTVGDIKNLKFYVKTYEDQVLRGVDLMSFDLDAKTVITAPLKPNVNPPPLEFTK
jgi:choloylglycine hydrolase